MMYIEFSSRVICGKDLTDSFPVNTGVKQGCILSPFLFIICIDWLMKKTTENKNRGMRWTFTEHLEDLDFADDIALLAQRHIDIQSKSNDLVTNAHMIGLNINRGKTKILRSNSKCTEPVMIENTRLEDVTEFVYLGSKITADGNSEEEINSRISKARRSFASLKNIWKSTKLKQNTKLRIFRSNVLGVLLYGAESWKVTCSISHKLDTFQTRCLRRILKIFWPNTITNVRLHQITNTVPISEEIKKRKWRWIGHVCRMEPSSIPKVAMRWTPDGKRKRGRPKETWRRSVEKEMKDNGWSWGQIQHQAEDRHNWRSLVAALCASKHEED